MTSEFAAKVVQELAHQVARGINEAAVLAEAAEDLGKKGLTDRALKSLLNVEPLIHEASVLMSASLIVHHHDRDRLEY